MNYVPNSNRGVGCRHALLYSAHAPRFTSVSTTGPFAPLQVFHSNDSAGQDAGNRSDPAPGACHVWSTRDRSLCSLRQRHDSRTVTGRLRRGPLTTPNKPGRPSLAPVSIYVYPSRHDAFTYTACSLLPHTGVHHCWTTFDVHNSGDLRTFHNIARGSHDTTSCRLSQISPSLC